MSPAADDWAMSILLGAALALGAALILSATPRWRAPSLTRRIAPYIRDVTDPHGLSPAQSGGRGAGASGWIRGLLRRASGLFSGTEAVTRRLRQAGRSADAAAHRARQLAWAIVGLVTGAVVAVVMAVAGATPATWLLPAIGAAVGGLGYDAVLTRRARARVARIEEELPTVLEFLALCLSAGEGILDALRRVAGVGGGELGGEVRSVVVAVGTGASLPDALSRLARELSIPAVSRTIDQLVAAIHRGAPLAHVLHAQAEDAREAAKRGLIERGGRNELRMLVPLVFFVLPLSVLFAVFPGVFMLRIGIG